MVTIEKIKAIFFSPTGGTKKIVEILANKIGTEIKSDVEFVDLTMPSNRQKPVEIGENELAILATPTYAGRIPNKLLPDLSCIKGSGGYAIAVAVFGNRSFDDCLMEQCLLLENQGFRVIGGCGIVCRHAFSRIMASDRPDETDFEQIELFAKGVSSAIRGGEYKGIDMLGISGNNPVESYYTPLKEDNTPAKFLKAKPKTDLGLCDKCGVCAEVCPMQSISYDDYNDVPGICIKCQACVRKCHSGAKFFDDEDFLSHVRMLEQNYQRIGENRFFL